jgi:hypothetical protein
MDILKIANKIAASKPSKEAIVKYFNDNPNPKDADFHKWAEDNNYNVHEAETIVYTLATMFAKFLSGGRANEKKVTSKDVDPEQLKMGIKVEQEHIDDEEVAARIAIDHLAEFDKTSPLQYYTGLKLLETFMESLDKDKTNAAQRIEFFKKLVKG